MTSRPNDLRCRRALAAVQLAAGRPQDALATLQPLLGSEPDVSTMRLAAAVYEANKDTPNAVKILQRRHCQGSELRLPFTPISLKLPWTTSPFRRGLR